MLQCDFQIINLFASDPYHLGTSESYMQTGYLAR
jgi:hypothetical protein